MAAVQRLLARSGNGKSTARMSGRSEADRASANRAAKCSRHAVGECYIGENYSLSYAKLVEQNLGLQVDKQQTRSDWLQRPLSDDQLHYAVVDVEHLVAILSNYSNSFTTRAVGLGSRRTCAESQLPGAATEIILPTS